MSIPAKAGFVVRCNVKGEPTGRSHLWTGCDTACRMWSTGGLSAHHRFQYYITPPTKLCHNCHAERHGVEEPNDCPLFVTE